jgi:hypothetical protein
LSTKTGFGAGNGTDPTEKLLGLHAATREAARKTAAQVNCRRDTRPYRFFWINWTMLAFGLTPTTCPLIWPSLTRRQKLIGKARNNPSGLRFQEQCLLAEHVGFSKRGGKGSHVVYEKDGVEEILTFQDRMRMAKSYQVRQLLAMIEKYQLGEKG